MRRSRRLPGILEVGVILAALLLLTAGCGRRGAPLPPRAAAPEAVPSLAAEAQARSVRLTWTRPSRDTDGRTLHDLQEFRLFRAVGADPTFAQIAAVRADFPGNAVVRGSRYLFQDDGGGRGLDPSLRYVYRIVAVNSRGIASAPSPEAAVEFLGPPPAPADLKASVEAGAVELAWAAPARPGKRVVAVAGYNVYRRTEAGAYGSAPINARPVTATRFRDAGVQADTTYLYAVRSVSALTPPWRESADSAEASVRLVDRTPPAPPQGLVALPVPGGVTLSWRPNTEPDLLGYLVYRREAPAIRAQRLTPSPIAPTAFTDRTARPGAVYVYSVTALDRSRQRNESAPSAEVEVTAGR